MKAKDILVAKREEIVHQLENNKITSAQLESASNEAQLAYYKLLESRCSEKDKEDALGAYNVKLNSILEPLDKEISKKDIIYKAQIELLDEIIKSLS
jgi:hypothetical protein